MDDEKLCGGMRAHPPGVGCVECLDGISSTAERVLDTFSECDRLRAENERLREVLVCIAYHEHCVYPETGESLVDHQYKIGVADGHRCAAQIARDALVQPRDKE